MKDPKALLLIQQAVSDIIFPHIMGANSAKVAWKILKEEYMGSKQVLKIKLQGLWKDFEILKMKQGGVKEFVDRTSKFLDP